MNNTFITVTWNSQANIKELIESILNYEPQSKIIVVDNHSSDNTVKIVRSFKNIRLIALKENMGFSAANNIGFDNTDTEYVTFINPDTKLQGPVIDNLKDEMRIKKAAMIGIKLENNDRTLQPSIFKFQTPINLFIEQFAIGKIMPEKLKVHFSPENSKCNKTMFVDWIMGAFIFTKSKFFKDVGGFSKEYFMYSEDMDLCYKYHLSGLKILFDPQLSLTHTGGASESQTSSEKSIKLLRSFCIFAKKYSLYNNINVLFYCYKLKEAIFKFINPERAKKYQENSEFLKGQLK